MDNTQLYTALVTPMSPDGQIDFEDLDKLITIQDKAGNGILLIGSTGEGLALDDDEKRAVVTHASKMDISAPVMVGVGGFNIEIQKEWIRECNQLNIDAFLLVAPLYSKPGKKGQITWFEELMDVAEKPCMIYNIPGRTGVKVPPEVIQELEGHLNFWSVKEASGNIEEYQAFREASPDVPFYSGDDALLPFFAAVGCSGLVSVASNVWPEETNEYVKRCLTGDSHAVFPVWRHAVEALFSASNPIPAKKLLAEKGWIKSPELRMPLRSDELTSLKHLKEADQAIKNWYQEIKKS